MNNNILYFAYGANTNLDSMDYRCHGAESLGECILHGWRLRFAIHADIVPDNSQKVHGVLWKISKEHLESLDIFEGYPRYYNRRILQIEYKSEIISAWAYYMISGNDESLPSIQYWNTVVNGYKDHFISIDQLTAAAAQANIADSNFGRQISKLDNDWE